MKDLFIEKNIKPMLIGIETEPFDSPDYIYELKLDGERCVAYLDTNGTELLNKRSIKMLPKVPELSDIHECIKCRCILDGELAVIKNGKPDFFEIQRRSLMSNPLKIQLAAQQYPACFTAFDILYYEDKQVTDLPLMQRKEILQSVIKNENSKFSISRFIEERGIDFYNLAKAQELEGIVAKKKDSKYYFDKRTKDWQKIKYLKDEDFVICGYILKENNVTSIILGQYKDGVLIDKGHVTLGVSREDFTKISSIQKTNQPLFMSDSDNSQAIWITPELVCTVKYMMKTQNGGIRQPVFKGLRDDKKAEECIDNLYFTSLN